MCDTPSEYKHGDTVWVKLGNCWWPGETVDLDLLDASIKEDLQSSSRGKLPFAVVKFFQEDSYEYVKKNDQIYPYNCSKKDEFIKKGIDLHRSKKTHMEKFPEDVIIAEKRTDGDEKILEDPKFAQPKKETRISDMFGSPKVKSSPKPTGRQKAGSNVTPGKKTPARFVTHPRFIGKRNDHKRIVLMQQKKEEAHTRTFYCAMCLFTSVRLDVIALHTKTHLKNDPLFNDVRKKVKKRAPKKHRIPASKTNSIDEDLALLEQGLSLSGGELSDGEALDKKKKKRQSRKRAPPAVAREEEATSVKKPAPNITNDLLAEWDDGDEDAADADEEEKSMEVVSAPVVTEKPVEAVVSKSKEVAVPKSKEAAKDTKPKAKTPAKHTPKAGKSKEKAEKDSAAAGKDQENGGKTTTTAEKLDIDFSALLETTKVPDLPNLPKTKADSVKIGAKSPEVATKLTNPKKRFVKSFEDFELSMKEKQHELQKDISVKEKEVDSDETKIDEVLKSDEIVTQADNIPNTIPEKSSVTKSEDKKQVVKKQDKSIEMPEKKVVESKSQDLEKSEKIVDESEKMIEEKKLPTRRSTRFEPEKSKIEPPKEKDVEIPLEVKAVKDQKDAEVDKVEKEEVKVKLEKKIEEKAPEEKKATRRTSMRGEKEKPEVKIETEKKVTPPIETKEELVDKEKKLTRRSSPRVEAEKVDKTPVVTKPEEKKEEPAEEKKSTRRGSSRSDKEKEKEKVEEELLEEKKSTTRRGLNRSDKEKEKEKVEEKVELRKSGRRSEVKPTPPKEEDKKTPAKEEEKDKKALTKEEDTAKKSPLKEEIIVKKFPSKEEDKDKKAPTKEEDKVKEVPAYEEEKDQKSLANVEEVKPESESDTSDIEKVDKSLRKKEDTKLNKDKETPKPDEKAKKENKAKSDDKSSKKEEKPTTVDESSKPAKKEHEKFEKSEKKQESKEKSKPKEKILFEIDVFSSLRAQENEKFKKKSEDSPRRETRASRSKSHSESSQERDKKVESSSTKVSKRGRKEDTLDETQVNNGKNEESSSPLISKMKNKLMNKLSSEQVPIPQKTPQRSISTDTVDKVGKEKPDTKKVDEKKPKREYSDQSSSNEDETLSKVQVEKKSDVNIDSKQKKESEDKVKSPVPSRRHSLRGAPAEKEDKDKKFSLTKSEDKKHVVKTQEKVEKVEEKSSLVEEKKPTAKLTEEKKLVTKAGLKSPPLLKTVGKPTGGPKTYLRSSRTEKNELPSIKTSLGSPVRALSPLKAVLSVTEVPVPEKVEKPEVKETATRTKRPSIDKPAPTTPIKDDVDKLVDDEIAEKLSAIENVELSRKSEPESSNTADWLKTLSPPKKKLILADDLPSRVELIKHIPEPTQNEVKEVVEEVKPKQTSKEEEKMEIEAIVDEKMETEQMQEDAEPTKVPSPVKTPKSPIKAAQSSVKTPPSPAKAVSPVKTTTSPAKTTTSPLKTPTSPVKIPTSPVKAPTAPVKTPTSPVKTPTSPSSPTKAHSPVSPTKTHTPFSPTKLQTSLSQTPFSPTKTQTPFSPTKTQSPISPTKILAPISPTKTLPPFSPTKTLSPCSPTKSQTPCSPTKTQAPSPTKIQAPFSPIKSQTPTPTTSSPIKSLAISPAKQLPLKSPPIILNKDAPKFDPTALSPKKHAKRDEEQKAASIKSPRRISLASQEVSITDKVEFMGNSKEEVQSSETVEEPVASEPIKELAAPGPNIEPIIPSATEPEADPLDLLASVSTFNKDVFEKNVTVVPEDILADGQVEIAKIIEDGTEKMASIPPVISEKEKPEAAEPAHALPTPEEVLEQITEPEEKTTVEAPAPPPQKPIILNSRLAADQESTSKLLDILTDNKRAPRPAAAVTKQVTQQVPLPKIATPKFDIEPKKMVTTAAPKQVGRILAGPPSSGSLSPSTSKTKPTILSDTLIRPADAVVSVQKVKRTYDDIEDIDTFIITKHPKKSPVDEDRVKTASPTVTSKSKPKILEHTIITAAGQVLQPISKKKTIIQQTIKVTSGSSKTVEEKVYDLLNSPKGKEDDTFDIDNMPIVMGDQLLTPDNIEAMPVVMAEQPKPVQQQVVRKVVQQIKPIPKPPMSASPGILKTAPTTKTYTKVVKGQRVYQTASTTSSPTILKHQPTILASGKQGKFVIVPSQSTAPPGTKYTVGKRPLIKKQPAILQSKSGQAVSSAEPSGNKIMIVTNSTGQQQRVLVTPEQQKLIGYQQVKKTIVKSSPAQLKERGKVFTQTASAPPGSGLVAVKKPKPDANKVTQQQKVGQKFSFQGSLPPLKGAPGQTRTVIIKNQQGEIVNRIHGTSDADIEKQVAEQLEAINRAANKSKSGGPVKRLIKKTVSSSSPGMHNRTLQNAAPASTNAIARNTVPPLAPITPKKVTSEQTQTKQIIRQQKTSITTAGQRVASAASAVAKAETAAKAAEKKDDRAPKQLVIQDAMGNETTIMEGQILALPSETVDGQPQSYMLVTLDESGSLTPLNNEALMSLDPNLNLGGDLSNMVLQIEGQGAGVETSSVVTTNSQTTTTTAAAPAPKREVAKPVEALPEPKTVEALVPEITPEALLSEEPTAQTQGLDQLAEEGSTEQIHAITCSINKGDMQQNLIITGDPVATQKFLESLTEGNPDIANLLAHVEGQNILIHTDGQQILINSDVDNQMLMSLNSQLGGDATDESQVFASQASAKNQDILAAALADTDVFQQEQTIAAAKMTQSQLSPGYPMAVNNVLETSTVNSPIMTPLEVPSAISKIKESDVLTQVTKNVVDLPITITDPNIAQSVANQQVNLMAAELAKSMELTIPGVVATTSAEMSSPSFYSLPTLDDSDKFTSPISMPLLTEDPEDVQTSTTTEKTPELGVATTTDGSMTQESGDDGKAQEGTAEYLLATSDMCTMSNQMSSLSEPPQDMLFDFPVDQAYVSDKTSFCTTSEHMSTEEEEEEISAASLLADKSPKRALDDLSGEEVMSADSKRAKLD